MAKIRHVAIFTLKEGVDVSKITAGLQLLRDSVPGFTRAAFGPDAGLKTGNAGYAVSFDFPNEAAYKQWDTNAEHERIRKELIFPLLSGISRVQFRIED